MPDTEFTSGPDPDEVDDDTTLDNNTGLRGADAPEVTTEESDTGPGSTSDRATGLMALPE